MKWRDGGRDGLALGRAPAERGCGGRGAAVSVETANVTAFSLEMGSGGCPLDLAHLVVMAIDGQKVTAPGPMSDRSWSVHFLASERDRVGI